MVTHTSRIKDTKKWEYTEIHRLHTYNYNQILAFQTLTNNSSNVTPERAESGLVEGYLPL